MSRPRAVVTPGLVPTGIAVVPGATPIAVDAGAVGWFDVGADGSYAYNVADVDEVCAEVDQASCAALANGDGERVTLATAPKSIITSPSTGQAIVVGDDDATGNQVFVVALPDQGDTTAPPSPTPDGHARPDGPHAHRDAGDVPELDADRESDGVERPDREPERRTDGRAQRRADDDRITDRGGARHRQWRHGRRRRRRLLAGRRLVRVHGATRRRVRRPRHLPLARRR